MAISHEERAARQAARIAEQIQVETEVCYAERPDPLELDEMLALSGISGHFYQIPTPARRTDSRTHRYEPPDPDTNRPSPLTPRPVPKVGDLDDYGHPFKAFTVNFLERKERERITKARQKATYLKRWGTHESPEKIAAADQILRTSKPSRKHPRPLPRWDEKNLPAHPRYEAHQERAGQRQSDFLSFR